LSETQFNRSVNIALRSVAEKLLENHDLPTLEVNPVEQLSSNYYVVRINDEIDVNLLEDLLRQELSIRNINTDFEYGIYDCYDEKMVYGNYVQIGNKGESVEQKPDLPVWEDADYYFGVFFPKKNTYLLGQMKIWLFSTLVLLVIILFFVYALWVILKQRRLSSIQKDFINNMTHEFKTPISTIGLSANVIQNPDIIQDPEKLKNYAGIISEENLRLKTQVERILQVVTLDKGDITVDPEIMDIQESIRDVVAMMEPMIMDKKGVIEFNFKADNTTILIDSLHFKNIIFNLLDNALKYCHQSPEILIGTSTTIKEVEIRIKDNGVGIDRSQLKKIFEKFYRIPTGDQHDVKGFGLGLHYVSRVVKMFKGKIRVESAPGSGSAFILILPKNNR